MMDKTELLQKLQSGEIKPHSLEKYISADEAVKIRREYYSNILNFNLSNLDSFSFDPNTVVNRNCENVIGGVSLPVGIAGPIHVKGVEEGKFYLPIATTEGALVASINRGAKAITKAGGARVLHNYSGITRAPVFSSKNLDDSYKFTEFVKENLEVFKKLTKETSEYATLIDYKPFINGKTVWLRFAFDTTDAMGMNMAVEATKKITDYIEDNYDIDFIAMSGNVCIDKKTGIINETEGRGREVQAEIELSNEICEEVLKCTPERLFEVGYKKLWQGSRIAGSFGVNAHAANMISALFIATGQDPAHVVDASNTITTFELTDSGIYINIKIPSLNIATLGGGTHIKPQNDLINLILTDVDSKKQVKARTVMFAQIIGAAVLAGELSLNAAFASRSFTKSHNDLGRGRS